MIIRIAAGGREINVSEEESKDLNSSLYEIFNFLRSDN
jgi:hypothetical protein